jgi:hypothetical protein
MKKTITVIGSSNVDFIMKAPHLPRVRETVADCVFQQTFGGKGANQAVAAGPERQHLNLNPFEFGAEIREGLLGGCPSLRFSTAIPQKS